MPATGGVVATNGDGTIQRPDGAVAAASLTAVTVPHCGTAPAEDDCTVRSTTTPGPPVAVTSTAYVVLAGTREAELTGSVHDESAGRLSVNGATGPDPSCTCTVTCSGRSVGFSTVRADEPPVTSTVLGTYQRPAGDGAPSRSDRPDTPLTTCSWSSSATTRPERAITMVPIDFWSWTNDATPATTSWPGLTRMPSNGCGSVNPCEVTNPRSTTAAVAVGLNSDT